MSDDQLQERIDEIEEQLESLQTSQQAYREHVVKPRLDDLEGQRDDARDERAELRQTVERLEQEVASLHAELRSIAGVTEDQETSPDKRVSDLRQAMVRRAKARTDGGEGYTSLWWKEVQKLFADLGHGEICKPDCYKAMNDAVDADGFELGTKRNENGRDVKAILLNTAELPALKPSSDPTTPEPVAGTEDRRSEGVRTKSD